MINIVVGVVAKSNKFLLIKRQKIEKDLIWSFPSGKVEKYESLEQAVVREVFEETNVVAKINKQLGQRVNKEKQVYITYFALNYVSGNESNIQALDEVEELGWFNINEVYKKISKDLIFDKVIEYMEG